MKIKHNIQRKGNVLEGQILETIFEDGERRGYSKIVSPDGKFEIESFMTPEIKGKKLFVWGADDNFDSKKLYFNFDTEREAQEVLDYINEFTVREEKENDNLSTTDKEYYEKHLQDRLEQLENEKEKQQSEIRERQKEMSYLKDQQVFIKNLLNGDLDEFIINDNENE